MARAMGVGRWAMGDGRWADMYILKQDTDCTPRQKGNMLPRASAAATARHAFRHAFAAATAHVPVCSMRSSRGHHSASQERPAYLNTGGRTMLQADAHARRRRTSGLYAFR